MLDLSKDIRFNELSFIAGPPHFRYYAGVPLRTSRGINIGSIYILDSKVRRALTWHEKAFLGIMADNVMQHLEMTRDKKDRQRTFRMNECLSAYVDLAYKDGRHRRPHSHHSDSNDADSDADSRRTADGSERIEVITRAAELLREAMDLEEGGGGVLFLDTALAAVPRQQTFLGNDRHSESAAVGGSDRDDLQKPSHQIDVANSGFATTRSSSPEMRRNHPSSTDVLAHSYRFVGTLPDQPEFTPFTPEELSKIFRRHPRGKMFTFDQQGNELSDSSDNGNTSARPPKSRRRQENSSAEHASIHAHFPRARQIIFIPVWDSTTSRSAACFVYNCSEYRNFSHQLDFLHCITFNNCVDTELMKLANLKANEQKSDFVGSISHELRSPLHGILASCEFLQDTSCTSFQQSLVNTAESCARTLLDTVNMVLDYSKINAFEKAKAGSASHSDIRPIHSETLQTNLSTHRNVDLAVLAEEVVEGVATGHAYNDPHNRALRHEAGESTACGKSLSNDTTPPLCKPDVKLVVDISKQDWMYWCEPGAIRRIVMNLVGNSIKYTKAGFIHVELTTQSYESESTEYVVLTVTDSGQGMSSAYLKNKLFTPFAQESNQAPGIGLGLSLVKSIVSTLGGHITIDSTLGVGTKAIVELPLKRHRNESATNSNRLEKNPISTDDCRSFQTIAAQATGKSVALFWRENGATINGRNEGSGLMRKSLTTYLDAWCGFSVGEWHKDCTADIIVTEETNLDALLHESPKLSLPGCRTMILLLRSTTSMESAGSSADNASNVEAVRHPFGPYKLSRALLACLDRTHSNSVGTVEDEPSGGVTISSIEEMTVAAGDIRISDNESTSNGDNIAKHDSPNVYDDGPKARITTELANTEKHEELSDEILSPSHHRITFLANHRSVSSPAALDEQETPSPVTKPSPNAAATNISTPFTKATSSKRTQRILLVDDNTINLRLLQVGVRKRGYTAISSAQHGLEAVNTYRSLLHATPPSPPSIILMDLSMPVMNGFEATRQIREIEAEYNVKLEDGQAPHHALIIALTGLASIRDQKEAYTCGVDSYIMKPVSFAKLTKSLDDWTVDGKVQLETGVSDIQ